MSVFGVAPACLMNRALNPRAQQHKLNAPKVTVVMCHRDVTPGGHITTHGHVSGALKMLVVSYNLVLSCEVTCNHNVCVTRHRFKCHRVRVTLIKLAPKELHVMYSDFIGSYSMCVTRKSGDKTRKLIYVNFCLSVKYLNGFFL